MRIAAAGTSISGGHLSRRGTAPAATEPKARGTTALVAIAPVPARPAPAFAERRRPEACVVAQLFAVREDAPQYREKRKAAPATAIASYVATRAAMVRAGIPRPVADLVV